MGLKPGDRCRLTREAVQLVGRFAAQTGVVLRESARGEWVIQFDNRKTPQYWHKDFIKPDPAVPNGVR